MPVAIREGFTQEAEKLINDLKNAKARSTDYKVPNESKALENILTPESIDEERSAKIARRVSERLRS